MRSNKKHFCATETVGKPKNVEQDLTGWLLDVKADWG